MEILCSVRDGLTNADREAVPVQWRQLPNGFADTGVPLLPSDVSEMVAGKNVLVMVHGYNCDFQGTLDTYQQVLSTQLRGTAYAHPAADVVIGFFWPGGDRSHDYFDARQRVDAIGRQFSGILATLRTAGRVDINAHSLGCRLVLKALGQPGIATPVVDVSLAAAATPDNVLSPGTAWKLHFPVRSLIVLSSRNDIVLAGAYPVGEKLSTWENFPTAMGLNGPIRFDQWATQRPEVQTVDCSRVVYGHGKYRETDSVWSHIAKEASRSSPSFVRRQSLRLV